MIPASKRLHRGDLQCPDVEFWLIEDLQLAVLECAEHLMFVGLTGNVQRAGWVRVVVQVLACQSFQLVLVQRFAQLAEYPQTEQCRHMTDGLAHVQRDAAGDNHRLQRVPLACAAQEGNAIHALHADVAEGDVYRPVALQQLQRLPAVRGFKNAGTAQMSEERHGVTALYGLVLQDQDAKGGQWHLNSSSKFSDASLPKGGGLLMAKHLTSLQEIS